MVVLDRRQQTPKARSALHHPLFRRRSGEDERPEFLDIVRRLFRQWRAERRLRRRNGGFRTTDLGAAAQSYGGMTDREFEAINGPQEWANWRLIPRTMADLPDRPLTVVDLGCGSGGSTTILARCSPPESKVFGYDVAAGLLRSARQRRYVARDGGRIHAVFRRQSITETLLDAESHPLPDGSVDVAHASGIVGHHLEPDLVVRLAEELRRVLQPSGVAILDAGPKLGLRDLTRIMTARGFDRVRASRLLPLNPRVAAVFRR